MKESLDPVQKVSDVQKSKQEEVMVVSFIKKWKKLYQVSQVLFRLKTIQRNC